MRRRQALSALAFVSIPGCSSFTGTNDTGRTVSPVGSSPNWLTTSSDCDEQDDRYAISRLEIAEGMDSSVNESSTVTVDYEMFNKHSKTIIKFAIGNEDASTCKEEGASYFRDFWSTIEKEGYDKYWRENGDKPAWVYIRINDMHPINEFSHRDVTYY